MSYINRGVNRHSYVSLYQLFNTYVQIKAIMVIRKTSVSVIEQPHVSDISDLVVSSVEEMLKVFSSLSHLWKPNHGGHVWFP